jgi:hypothetical protein
VKVGKGNRGMTGFKAKSGRPRGSRENGLYNKRGRVAAEWGLDMGVGIGSVVAEPKWHKSHGANLKTREKRCLAKPRNPLQKAQGRSFGEGGDRDSSDFKQRSIAKAKTTASSGPRGPHRRSTEIPRRRSRTCRTRTRPRRRRWSIPIATTGPGSGAPGCGLQSALGPWRAWDSGRMTAGADGTG